MSNPAKVDISIVAGDDEVIELELVDTAGDPIDLTGRTYALEVRANPTGTGTADCTFTCTVPTPANGIVLCDGPAAQTDNLVVGDAYYWSLLETVSGDLHTLVTGRVSVLAQVTKD